MLRLNVNVVNAPYYSIPSDNPFVSDPNAMHEIYALGLRNPWRWSFDKKTGDTWIGDVGQDKREEIDFRKRLQAGGTNYGWRCYEGTITYNTESCASSSQYVFPVFDYQHDVSTGGASVTGGYVYRGTAFPELYGYYICCDYVSANAWKIKSNGAGGWNVYLQQNIPASIESFGEDENGELYASALTGDIYQVVVAANGSFAQSSKESNEIAAKGTAFVHPTVVDNSTITIVLTARYDVVRVLTMQGAEVMKQDISGTTGEMSLHLPKLNAGTYIVQLVGETTAQQKIYVAK